MFKRELRSKLPELREDMDGFDESVRERDWRNKLTQKAYADSKRGATSSDILPGDQVLLRNTKTTWKLATNYESEPYTVVTKEGNEVMVESGDGAIYRRDSSFVKPYNKPLQSISETEAQQKRQLDSELATSVRPKRVIRLPEKFNDFVMDKPV